MFAALSDRERTRLTTSEANPAMTLFGLLWPWPFGLFKPKETRRRELVIGAAFFVAEIEKIDRARARQVKV